MKELKSKDSQSNSQIFIKYLIWWTGPIISWISIIQYTVKHTDNVLLAFSSLRRCNVSFWWYAAEVGALSLPRGQRISRRGGICWSPWHWDKGLCIWNMNVSVINDKHIMRSYTWWNLIVNLIIKGTEYIILSFCRLVTHRKSMALLACFVNRSENLYWLAPPSRTWVTLNRLLVWLLWQR